MLYKQAPHAAALHFKCIPHKQGSRTTRSMHRVRDRACLECHIEHLARPTPGGLGENNGWTSADVAFGCC